MDMIWALTTHKLFHAIQLDNDGNACGHCDACKLRKEGFLLAGLDDPTVYKN
jgi:7-cyano-7-deazaguanine synthase in queuosine biosynthesis